jgi:putative FmdB family regulatory protein
MPIYDYKCRSCGEEFEQLVLGSKAAVCPACESADLEQLLSTGIAVSSDSIRQSNVTAERKKLRNSNNYKDKKIADVEEVKEHAPHLFTDKKPGKSNA